MWLLAAVVAVLVASLADTAAQRSHASPLEEGSARNQVAILDGDGASMQERIETLRHYAAPGDEFHFSTAMFREDQVGKTLMYELAAAAKRGVRVRGIFDPALNHLPDAYVHYLVSAGVELVEFHPMGDSVSRRFGTFLKAGKGISWLNNRSHDKVWALKKKLPNGQFEYLAIEGSRNLVDSHFGLNSEIEKTFPNGRLPRKGAELELLRPAGLQFQDMDIFIRGDAAREIIEYHSRVLAGGHTADRDLIRRLRKFNDWKRTPVAEQKEVLSYLETQLAPDEMRKARRHLEALSKDSKATLPETVEAMRYLDNLTPEKTARDIANTHRNVIEQLNIVDHPAGHDPFEKANSAKIRFYHDSMRGNTPQGSEQAILSGIADAQGGDLVRLSVNGETIETRYTAELHGEFEKLKSAKPGTKMTFAGRSITTSPEILQAAATALENRKAGDIIHMVSQYAVPTPEILDVFRNATSRGVTIKLVVNGAVSMWDGELPKRGYEFRFRDLVDTGIEIREASGLSQIHAKALTVTNPLEGPRYVVIGSSNLDPRSLTVTKPGVSLDALSTRLRNSEVNWRIYDAPSIVAWYETKIGQTHYGGNLVARGGAIIRPRRCPAIMRFLLSFPPAYRVL